MKKPSSDGPRFGTLAVHAGQEPEPTTGAIIPPIFQTSTYVQPDVAEPKQGYDYARVRNPTTVGLEQKMAALEGGAHGIAFSSGLAAIEAVVKRLSVGDHVVCEENTYGGVTDIRFRESGLTRDAWDTASDALKSRKLLNKAGAITTSGRNAVNQNSAPINRW